MADEARNEATVPDVDETSTGLFGDEEPTIPNEGVADEKDTDENVEKAPGAPDIDAAERIICAGRRHISHERSRYGEGAFESSLSAHSDAAMIFQ